MFVKGLYIVIFLLFGNLLTFAQDDSEENVFSAQSSDSELRLEQNDLDFSANFIDAVHLKSVENYNKALEALGKCEKIYPKNVGMLFEKAKNYAALNQFIEALHYCDKALQVDSNNFWVKSLKRDVFLKQNNFTEALQIQKVLYEQKSSEVKNLLLIYYRMNDIENGKKLLKEVDSKVIFVENKSFFIRYFESKNIESDEDQQEETPILEVKQEVSNSTLENDLEIQLKKLQTLDVEKKYAELTLVSQKGLERYPTHPSFYYYLGKTQNSLKKYKEAIPILENGLDFIFDNAELQIKFYRELVIAHAAIGNTSKSTLYKQLVQKLQ